MSCNDVCVEMDPWDCPGNAFYRESMPRARKPHRCEECHGVIAKGDSHHYATGKSDGEFWQARTCAPCHEIRKTFSCGTWVIGMLWESVDEQVFPKWDEMVAIDCLARLTTDAAIEKMRARYFAFRMGEER